jgi:hypothetical protein
MKRQLSSFAPCLPSFNIGIGIDSRMTDCPVWLGTARSTF